MIEAKHLRHELTESAGNLPKTSLRIEAVDDLGVRSATRLGRSIACGRGMR